jgi:hypothetical protein
MGPLDYVGRVVCYTYSTVTESWVRIREVLAEWCTEAAEIQIASFFFLAFGMVTKGLIMDRFFAHKRVVIFPQKQKPLYGARPAITVIIGRFRGAIITVKTVEQHK